MAVPACPQFDEIVPTSRNTIIVKRLAVTASEPQVPAPSVEDVVWILNACILALDGFWLDDVPALFHNLQADISPMAFSTIVPRGAYISVDLILLLVSRASCCTSSFPLLVDLGPETSIVSVTLDDGNRDDNTPAGVSPAEAPNKVLSIKESTVVCSKLQVPLFSARDITVILDDLNLCVSAPASFWFDILISLYDLQVDVSMYPSRIPQPEGYIDISLILLLATRATCCGPLLSLVDIGPSDTSIVEVISDDVEVWTDLNQTLVDEDLEIIFSPQNILFKKFSTITAKPRVSTFSIRDIVGILGDLDIYAFASKSVWLDLPGLFRDIRLDFLALVLSATPQLGDRVNVDLVLLLASMVISRTSSFPRIVDRGTSSIVEVALDGEDLMDNDHTLSEDTNISLIKKDPAASLARDLNPNAAVFVPSPSRLPPSYGGQELADPSKISESEAPAPLSRRARARRLAAARKRRAQLSEIHATPIKTPSRQLPHVLRCMRHIIVDHPLRLRIMPLVMCPPSQPDTRPPSSLCTRRYPSLTITPHPPATHRPLYTTAPDTGIRPACLHPSRLARCTLTRIAISRPHLFPRMAQWGRFTSIE
ncbi:hypothetical protein BD779DRAFT_1673884 [Infundibulicybe gibba]|nr:hypothetical protein BD779DRAFT_1673884 [Infundibulicybe gibba]